MYIECRTCANTFEVSQEDREFYLAVAPRILNQVYDFPAPALCPLCREQRRLLWRNERYLYRRKCSLSGQPIISMFQPDTEFPVYERNLWWQDNWDARKFGREYDFSKGFFAQFAELMSVTPQYSMYHSGSSENCDYCNYTLDNKNCYLCFSVTNSEDCLYCGIVDDSKDCLDCLNVNESELAYECVDCLRCYHSFFLLRCVNCSDCWICADCFGCKNCFGCSNLSNASNCWFNQQLSAAAYQERVQFLKQLKYSDIEHYLAEFSSFNRAFPKKYAQILNCENCTGDRLHDCRDCRNCFDIHEAENVRYAARSFKIKDSQDFYGVSGHELLYQVLSGRGFALRFALCSYDNNDCTYVYNCFNSNNLFGCIALNHQEFCILNKQYSQHEYTELVPKIIKHMQAGGEWGEFFPAKLSPFGYNETVAYEAYPLKKEQALKTGFNWSDYEAPPSEGSSQALRCSESGKLFRTTEQELEFYKRNSLPLPHLHPNIRHQRRLKLRNPRRLINRACDSCHSMLLSTYSEQAAGRVYCQRCYESHFLA